MEVDALIAIGGGLGTLVLLFATNRKRIAQIENALWGHEKSESEGLEGEHQSLDQKIDSLGDKIDERRDVIDEEHDAVRQEIVTNRLYNRDTLSELTEELSEKDDLSEVNVDLSEIEPNWFDESQLRERETSIREMD